MAAFLRANKPSDIYHISQINSPPNPAFLASLSDIKPFEVEMIALP